MKQFKIDFFVLNFSIFKTTKENQITPYVDTQEDLLIFNFLKPFLFLFYSWFIFWWNKLADKEECPAFLGTEGQIFFNLETNISVPR